MKNILKNSLIVILFILFILFKDSIYELYDNKEYNFNYLKENELLYYKNEYQKISEIKKDNKYIFSKIIFRDIYDFYNKMIISKGKNYNIKKGDLVVSESSLVGIVESVSKKSSSVILLYNPDLKLSVKINDTYGILESKNNKLYVKNIISESNIQKGDIVYTSGLTDKMENIPIGKVINVEETNEKIEKIVEVEGLTNLKELKYIMVIHEVGDNE
ncbi:MAG: rod shape-determining protein MreC [Firmicutes bacterium]|nr:rod shape-determining protein MreC [Bacillota bacterium]